MPSLGRETSCRFVNIVRLLIVVEVHHVRFLNEFGTNRRLVTCSLGREAAVPFVAAALVRASRARTWDMEPQCVSQATMRTTFECRLIGP